MRCQRAHRLIRVCRPPSKSSRRKPFLANPVALTIVHKDLDRRFASVAEYKQISTHRIGPDHAPAYRRQSIDAFAKVYFNPATQMTARAQSQLYAYIDPGVDRYKAIETEDEKDEFKKSLRTWTNLYSFLAQIMPFQEPDLEKFFAYARLLQIKLPKADLSERLQVTDEVALEYYRLQKIKEGSIELEADKDGELDGLSEAGIKREKEEKAALSEIIDLLNERFGTEFEEADKLFFDQIETELMQDETLQIQAKANKIDTFKYAFEELFLSKLIDRMDQNQDIFEKILEDKAFGSLVREWMMKKVYAKLNVEAE